MKTVLLSHEEFSLLFHLSREALNVSSHQKAEHQNRREFDALRELLEKIRIMRRQMQKKEEGQLRPSSPAEQEDTAIRSAHINPESVELVELIFQASDLHEIIVGLKLVRDRLGETELNSRTGFCSTAADTLIKILEKDQR